MRKTTGFAGLVGLTAAAVFVCGGIAQSGAEAAEAQPQSWTQAAPVGGSAVALMDNKGNG